jgi:HAD superfamily hydrolase (TIGR01457 family)
MKLSSINGVIMDMDGVLWRGDTILPGVAAFFDFLSAHGLPFVLASNNSSKTPADYVAKLAGMGVGGVTEQQIVTSGTATVDYLQTHYPSGSPVHVLGGDGLKALVTGAGFLLSDEAQIVVVGIDFNLTYNKLKRAATLIRNGADFIGTNGDATFPLADGLAPGAGSLLAALRTATDREPLVIGKPNKPMYEAALHTLGTAPQTTLMIGDRLDTDIQGAQQAGLLAALVFTGVTNAQILAASDIQPEGIYNDLPALMAAWE